MWFWRGNFGKQHVCGGFFAVALADGFEHVSKRPLRIGIAHGAVALAGWRMKAVEVPVVGKQPIFAPHFTHERVGVGQLCLALRGFANVGYDVFGFDLVSAHQIGHGRMGAGLVIVKQTHAFALEKADAEAVCMLVG